MEKKSPFELAKLQKKLSLLSATVFLLSVLVIVGAFICHFNWWQPAISEEIALVQGEETKKNEWDVANGIHLSTGLIAEGDFMAVANNCLGCHSAKLVTQNRMSKEAWKNTIKWMQESQNLWDLGDDEPKILAYLSTYYVPKNTGRRKPLEITEWHTIE